MLSHPGPAKDQPATTARTIYLIKRAQFASYLRLEECLQPFELTAAQYMVMSVLGHRDQLSSAQLSRRFSVKPQSMFKLITTLTRKGLISRKELDNDRRTLEVSLTPAGRRLLDACEQAVDALEADLLKNFSATQLAQFRRALVKFLAGTPHGRAALAHDRRAGLISQADDV
ncbi:MAG TPA: MarR family transcriptional regulator [Xanthobacteraceae bacterium]